MSKKAKPEVEKPNPSVQITIPARLTMDMSRKGIRQSLMMHTEGPTVLQGKKQVGKISVEILGRAVGITIGDVHYAVETMDIFKAVQAQHKLKVFG